MRLGMIVRRDSGGLGRLTRWMAGWLAPERIIVVALDERPPVVELDVDADQHVATMTDLDDPIVCDRLVDGLDVLWTAETFYTGTLLAAARVRRVRTLLYAMPELFDPTDPAQAADSVAYPTTWLEGRPVVPLPSPIVPDDVIEPVDGPPTFIHVSARAMRDRSGTETLIAALAHVRNPMRVVLRGAGMRGRDTTIARRRLGASLTIDATPAVGWRDLYRDAHVLVEPRRYGGLSLPVVEAASLGLGLVLSDLEPQRTEVPCDSIPSVGSVPVRMKGGPVPVHRFDPIDLGGLLDRLATSPGDVYRLRVQARDWSAARSWEAVADRWEAWLAGDRIG